MKLGRLPLRLACVLPLVVAACGGSSGGTGTGQGGGTTAPLAVDEARFLTQATFGPTRDEIDRLAKIGYEKWFQEQRNAPASLTRPGLTALPAFPGITQQHRLNKWWRHAVQGEDQLRQRMAWALSQIMVASESSDDLRNQPMVMAEVLRRLRAQCPRQLPTAASKR